MALGFLAASVLAGFVSMQSWWTSDWHWMGGLMVALGVGGLFGIDTAILLAGLVGLGEASWLTTYVAYDFRPLPYVSQVGIPVPVQVLIDGARAAYMGQIIGATVILRMVWEGLLSLLER